MIAVLTIFVLWIVTRTAMVVVLIQYNDNVTIIVLWIVTRTAMVVLIQYNDNDSQPTSHEIFVLM